MKLRITRDQADIMQDGARFRGVFCGRRWGKTDWAMMKGIKRVSRTKQKIAYITPVAAQSTPQYRRLLHHPEFSKLLAPYGCGVQPYPTLTHRISGGQIQFRTFERPGNIRSQGLDEVIVDEIQQLQDRETFWGVIRALIADRRGELTVCGQFRGKNWVYDDFWLPGQPGEKSRIPLYKSYRFPSATGIAFRSPAGVAELAEIKRTVPGAVWDQEYDCLPSENGARVFRAVARCVKPEYAPVYEPVRGRSYVLMWDTSTVVDPPAWLVLDVTPSRARRLRVCNCGIWPPRTEMPVQLADVAKIQKRYNNCTVAMDLSGAGTRDRLLDFVREKVNNPRGIYFGNGNKEELVNLLSVEFELGRIEISPDLAELEEQLLIYEYEYRGKRIEYGAPAGKHDDLVSCLLGALAMALDNWGENPNGVNIAKMFN